MGIDVAAPYTKKFVNTCVNTRIKTLSDFFGKYTYQSSKFAAKAIMKTGEGIDEILDTAVKYTFKGPIEVVKLASKFLEKNADHFISKKGESKNTMVSIAAKTTFYVSKIFGKLLYAAADIGDAIVS